MKHSFSLLICIVIGIGMGWYAGYTWSMGEYQRKVKTEYQPLKDQFEADIAEFHKHNAEAFKTAEPWQASSAGIALVALKNLSSNDVEEARSHLAAIVAIYYRGHSRDGDTNLLTNIVTFAHTDTVLSNAIYKKFQ